jgi:ankyrin repeat protein
MAMSFAPVLADVMEGSDVNARFLRSAASDRLSFVQIAMQQHPSFGAVDLNGDNAMMRAAMYNTKQVAELLLNAGFSTLFANSSGRTLLHVFAKNGWDDLVEKALAAGASIDARDDKGNTPLLEAASRGRVDTAKLLVDRGADLEVINFEGESAARYMRIAQASSTRDHHVNYPGSESELAADHDESEDLMETARLSRRRP